MAAVITYTPGMQIENGAEVKGALGCFVTRVSDSKIMLLSNAHILFGGATNSQGVNVYQPPSSSSCCKGALIASTLGSWAAGFRAVSVTMSEGPQTGYETDCAVALLKAQVKYDNTIPGGIGMITGLPPSGLGITGVVLFAGQMPQASDLVRFYSPMSNQVKFGFIIQMNYTATYTAGGTGAVEKELYPKAGKVAGAGDILPLVNNFLVFPVPPPGTPGTPPEGSLMWCEHGDSGSVVVNAANQVIGLVAAAKENSFPIDPATDPPALQAMLKSASGIGLVCPIGRVRAQLTTQGLDFTIPGSLSGTATAAGHSAAALRRRSEDQAFQHGRNRAAAALRATRLGLVILGKLRQHAAEARQLISRNRRVQVAWHRSQGPAFVQHIMHNLRDPAHRVPDSINGVSRAQALEAMADLLAGAGSPALRRDVARYRDLVMRHAPGLDSLEHVGEVVARARRELCGR